MREDPKLFRCNAHGRATPLHRDARVGRLDARSYEDSYHSFLADHVEADVVRKDRMNGDQSREREVNVIVRLVSIDQDLVERQGNVLQVG
jgi:hypothetical protein